MNFSVSFFIIYFLDNSKSWLSRNIGKSLVKLSEKHRKWVFRRFLILYFASNPRNSPQFYSNSRANIVVNLIFSAIPTYPSVQRLGHKWHEYKYSALLPHRNTPSDTASLVKTLTILFSTFIQWTLHILAPNTLINSEEYLCTGKYLWLQDTMPTEMPDELPNHIQNQHC